MKLPDDPTMIRLYEEGRTAKSVATEYVADPSSVEWRWNKLGLTGGRRPRHDRLLPWRLAKPYSEQKPARYLRLLAKGASGNTTDRRIGSAFNWAKQLEDNGEAIHFIPETGWEIRPATVEDQYETITITDRGTVAIALGSVPDQDQEVPNETAKP